MTPIVPRITNTVLNTSTKQVSLKPIQTLNAPISFTSPPPPRLLFECPEEVFEFDVSPDGTRFLLVLRPSASPPLRVILNAIRADP